MGHSFNNGDTVYLVDGGEVEYVCQHDSKHLVRAVYEPQYEGDDPHYGPIEEVDAVFIEPPKQKYAEEIAALRAEVEQLTAKKDELEHGIDKAESGHKNLLKKLQQVEALEYLSDWLDGKITHYVTLDYSRYNIADASAQTFRDYYARPNLLNLFGSPEKELKWETRLGRCYSDSRTVTCWPCRSKEEALAKVLVLAQRDYCAWKADPKQERDAKWRCLSAAAFGFKIPDDLAAVVKAEKVASAESALAGRQKDFNDCLKALEAAKNWTPELGV